MLETGLCKGDKDVVTDKRAQRANIPTCRSNEWLVKSERNWKGRALCRQAKHDTMYYEFRE